jgi:hypothetical protein
MQILKWGIGKEVKKTSVAEMCVCQKYIGQGRERERRAL